MILANKESPTPSTADGSNLREGLILIEPTQKHEKQEKDGRDEKQEKDGRDEEQEKEKLKIQRIKELMRQHHTPKKRKVSKPRFSKSKRQHKMDSVDSFFYFNAVLISILKLFGSEINYIKPIKKSIKGTKKFKINSLALPRCEGDGEREIFEIRSLFEKNYDCLCAEKRLNKEQRKRDKLGYINQKITEFIIDILEQRFSVFIVEKGYYKREKQSKGIPYSTPSANQIAFTCEGEDYNFFRNDISDLGQELLGSDIGIIPPIYLR